MRIFLYRSFLRRKCFTWAENKSLLHLNLKTTERSPEWDADKVCLSKHATVLEELIDALLVKFHKHYPDQKVNVEIPEGAWDTGCRMNNTQGGGMTPP